MLASYKAKNYKVIDELQTLQNVVGLICPFFFFSFPFPQLEMEFFSDTFFLSGKNILQVMPNGSSVKIVIGKKADSNNISLSQQEWMLLLAKIYGREPNSPLEFKIGDLYCTLATENVILIRVRGKCVSLNECDLIHLHYILPFVGNAIAGWNRRISDNLSTNSQEILQLPEVGPVQPSVATEPIQLAVESSSKATSKSRKRPAREPTPKKQAKKVKFNAESHPNSQPEIEKQLKEVILVELDDEKKSVECTKCLQEVAHPQCDPNVEDNREDCKGCELNSLSQKSHSCILEPRFFRSKQL